MRLGPEGSTKEATGIAVGQRCLLDDAQTTSRKALAKGLVHTDHGRRYTVLQSSPRIGDTVTYVLHLAGRTVCIRYLCTEYVPVHYLSPPSCACRGRGKGRQDGAGK